MRSRAVRLARRHAFGLAFVCTPTRARKRINEQNNKNAMQPIPRATPDTQSDQRKLAWRRSSLRTRRVVVGLLCASALAIGIIGSNAYNRLQGVDINDRSMMPPVTPLKSADAASAPVTASAAAPAAKQPATSGALQAAGSLSLAPARNTQPNNAAVMTPDPSAASASVASANESAAKKRVPSGPRLRMDSKLHDPAWLDTAGAQGDASTHH